MINPAKRSLAYPFALTPLPFAYDALEPFIDATTMQIHHEKHHQAYITNLNAALEPHPELHDFSIEKLLRQGDELPIAIRQTVHDHGGGHLHHQLFWENLKPGATGVEPGGRLAQAIVRDFGSYFAFKKKFVEVGAKHFGSGWVFLVADASGKLEILSRSDHDNILLESKTTLLINDLWEHAYYLKYRNNRADYLNAFWNVVDWDSVNQRLENLRTTKDSLSLVR